MNKSRVKIIVIGSAVLFLIALLYGSAIYYDILLKPNTPPLIIGQDIDANASLHLKLGYIYERAWLLDDALIEYEKALTLDSNSVQEIAVVGIERVLKKQNDYFATAIFDGISILWRGIGRFIKVFIIAAPCFIILFVLNSLFWRSGYLILPFNDFSDANMGEAIISSIKSHINSVRQIHSKQQREGLLSITEKLQMPSFGIVEDQQNHIAEVLTGLGSLQFGSINLPFGRFFSAFSALLRRKENIITGSIYRYGKAVHVVAEVKNARNGQITHLWNFVSVDPDQNHNGIECIEKELAFRILCAICPALDNVRWKSFQLFSEALEQMQIFESQERNLDILEQAACKLERAIIIDPGYALAKYNLGIIYNNLGRFDEARSVFQELKRIAPAYMTEIQYNLGISYYQLFQPWALESAVKEFKQIIERLEDQKRIGNRELLALAYCGVAFAYAEMAKYDRQVDIDQAQYVVKQAMELSKDSREIQAFAHAANALVFLTIDDPDKALDELYIAVSLKSDYHFAYTSLGQIYMQQDKIKDAVVFFKRALSINSRSVYTHYKLGIAYKRLEEIDAAIKEFQCASGIADAHNELGKIMASRGKYKEALTEFEKATELNHKHSEACANWAWYCIEAGKTNETDLQKAARFAERARDIELARGNSKYLWHRRDILGLVYLEQQQWHKAERELRESIKLAPSQQQNRYHLAYLKAKIGEFDAAKEQLIALFGISKGGLWRDKGEELMQQIKNLLLEQETTSQLSGKQI